MTGMRADCLEEVLAERHGLTPEQLEEARRLGERSGQSIGRSLVALRYIGERDLAQALSQYLGLPLVSLSDSTIDPNLLGLLPAEMALRAQVVPLAMNNGAMTVACADPLDVRALEDVRLLLGKDLHPVVGIARA